MYGFCPPAAGPSRRRSRIDGERKEPPLSKSAPKPAKKPTPAAKTKPSATSSAKKETSKPAASKPQPSKPAPKTAPVVKKPEPAKSGQPKPLEVKKPAPAAAPKPGAGGKAPAAAGAKPAPTKPVAGGKPAPGKSGAKGVVVDPNQPRFRNPFAASQTFADGKAAADRLAAAAGLGSLKTLHKSNMPEESNAKRLTKSPLGKKELKEFRDMLIDKRREIVDDVRGMETEALTGGSGSLSNLPQHMAEQGTDTFDQSMALNIAGAKRITLREIDAALERIDAGMYGVCEALGTPIEDERLRAEPWTRYSIEGARHKERTAYFQ